MSLSEQATLELDSTWNVMVVTYANKSSHDLVLACKSKYRAALHNELSSGKVYQSLMKPVDEVCGMHAKMADPESCSPVWCPQVTQNTSRCAMDRWIFKGVCYKNEKDTHYFHRAVSWRTWGNLARNNEDTESQRRG